MGFFPGGSVVKNPSTCNAGNPGSIPGWGISPGEGNGYSLQYSCLENLIDSGAGQVTVHRFTEIFLDPHKYHFQMEN